MKKYKRPPIAERALSFGVTIPEELFERRVEAWKAKLKESFPEVETVTNWLIKVTHQDGMPRFDTANQKLTLRHRFWKGKPEQREQGIQVWRDRIVFNLMGGLENPRHFEELESFAFEWLNRWADHFDVTEVQGLTLEYVNMISAATVPKFAGKDEIRLREILPTFANLPVEGRSIVPPYNFEINVAMGDDPPLHFRAHLQNVEPAPKHPLALRLEFMATTERGGRSERLDTVKKELTVAHDLILKEFEGYFSQEAKESFGPYDYDGTKPS